MSFSGVGNFVSQLVKSKWFKEQSPIVALAFLSLVIASHYVFHIQPEERRENRETWKQLRVDIQSGHEHIEEQQTKQVDRISKEFSQVHAQNMQLLQTVLRVKTEGTVQALKNLTEQVASTVDDNARESQEPQ